MSANQSLPEKNFSVIEKAPIWWTLSGTLILISLIMISLSIAKFKSPVKLGLDFTGGAKIEYKFKKPNDNLSSGNITEKVLKPLGKDFAIDSISQVSEKQYLILRTKELNLKQREKLDQDLKTNFGDFEVLSVDAVSGTIGPELLRSGLLALFITLIGILAFVSYRFSQDFAICAIIALCHDILLVIGLFAALGLFMGLEVNSLFLTACLTVLGFSIHDTIVVFDRIRENKKYLSKKKNLTVIIDESIKQVWFRSTCTSVTTLITLGALLIFGGESTKIFAGAMFAGILTGAYSSIFVASVLLGKWNLWQDKKKTASKKTKSIG